MKFLSVLVMGFISFVNLAHAQTSFPDDTMTEIQSRGSDCRELSIASAYFTEFGDRGNSGKAVVFNVRVRNLAFEKNFSVENEDQGQVENAIYSNNIRNQNVTAIFTGQSTGFDSFTLVDRRVGMSNRGTYSLKVKMGSQTFTCSHILVSIKPE